MTHGMLLGKFLPPHQGHMYLVDFAKNYVDDLTVVVGTLKSEPIAGSIRYHWMKQLFPQVRVLHLADENPQDPSEHPEFWKIWRESLEAILPARPDIVFASETYGVRLAKELGAEFVPVDPNRAIMPISGTAVRQDPWAHWSFLPAPVKAHYAIRVSIFGPESTGKSTLAQKLAQHFGSIAVPEYARTLLELKEGKLTEADMPRIARGQVASEEALAPRCNRILFCDTDVLATQIWSKRLYGRCDSWIQQAAANAHYDLTLVTDVDVPWVEDQVRYLPHDRKPFLDRCIAGLEQHSRRYELLSGGWDERFAKACGAVEATMLRVKRAQKRDTLGR